MLFWNPGCGFCQQMLPDLKQWEKNRPEAPQARGGLGRYRGGQQADGLTSTVVLDQQFAVGRAFGASGTPSRCWWTPRGSDRLRGGRRRSSGAGAGRGQQAKCEA